MACRKPQYSALQHLRLWMIALIIISMSAFCAAFLLPQSVFAQETEEDRPEELVVEAIEDVNDEGQDALEELGEESE